jgi:hypothetical protein
MREVPVYLKFGKNACALRLKPLNIAITLMALIPVCFKYYSKVHGQTTAVKEQQIQNEENLKNLFVLMFLPLDALFNTAMIMLCGGSRMRQC